MFRFDHVRALPTPRVFHGRERSVVVLVTTIGVLVLPAVALATTYTYWGYNYISRTNPAAGACYYNTTTAGMVCANTQADSSTVEKLAGDSNDYVANTFRGGTGVDLFNNDVTDTISALNATGSDPAEGPTCYHWGGSTGSSYIQCRYTQSGGI